MSLLARLIFFATWILNVHARNETVVDGWVPEPTGRGTWSILWSCLATIFVCTWSALHLSVPKRHGPWYLLTRKLKWMFWATVAPELILYISAQRFIEARDLSKYLVSDLGKQEWTLTQMQFACSGGFCIRTSSGQELSCSATQLLALIEKGDIDSPPIPEEELRSRGKSDLVIKIIAILQIIWFIVQTLVRAIQHYHITALEIVTVAFVLCSVFIYGFSMCQPQDVEFPVVLELQPAALAEAETTLKRDSDESNHALQDGGYVGMVLKVLSAALHNTTKQILNQSNHVGKRAGPTRYLRRSGVLSHIPRQATVPVILLGLFACAFGAVHCLAWKSPFPTSSERLAWRICSATTTALPASMILLPAFVLLVYMPRWGQPVLSVILALRLMALSYIIGRIPIMVLAFTTLRALPADAFQTVNWNDYLPHFAS